jgi:hypothetical protein
MGSGGGGIPTKNRGQEQREDRDMASDYSELCKFLMQENPYGSDVDLPENLDRDAVRDGRINVWYFEGRPRRVSRAIQIPYRYKTKDGVWVKESLLIGFEGGPGL